MPKKLSKNVKTVLDILKDEIKGDVGSALKKITRNYTMTWMYKDKTGKLFPKTKRDIKKELDEVTILKEENTILKMLPKPEMW